MATQEESPSNQRDDDALAGSNRLVELVPGVFGQQQAGWLLTIPTSKGLIQVDTGDEAQASIASIRTTFDDPFYAIVYSHGHPRYNFSARAWVLDNVERFGSAPRIIGHQNVVRRHQRYLDSAGLQNRIIERQFRHPAGSLNDRKLRFMSPTETFSDSLVIDTGDVTMEVLWAPSEIDDSIAAWIEKDRVLYGGPSCIPFFPNVGSPQRPVRDALRWANTLDKLASYPAETLILEFGPIIKGAEKIQDFLASTSAALRWCQDTVVRLMNEGYNSHEIVNMVEFPPEIFDRPWLAEGYTSHRHVLRDIYRGQFGWWEDQNPTSLNPAHPAEVATQIRAAIGDASTVLAHAIKLAEQGDLQLSLHVLDLIAMTNGDDDISIQARTLKAKLCRDISNAEPSYVSQSLYKNGADELDRKNKSLLASDEAAS